MAITVWTGFIPFSIGRPVPALGYAFLTLLSVVGYISDHPKVHGVIVSISVGFNLWLFAVATFYPGNVKTLVPERNGINEIRLCKNCFESQ